MTDSSPTRATKRLILRPFADSDRDAFAAMNADPEVMAHFPAPLSRAESDALMDAIEEKRARFGFSFDAIERSGELIGFCGLSVPKTALPFSPCVEIGWRLTRRAWSKGYASEAARDALARAFGPLGLDEVVSFTPTTNHLSMAVMTRIGMVRDRDGDFRHPVVAPSHPLSIHVLYRIGKERHDLVSRA